MHIALLHRETNRWFRRINRSLLHVNRYTIQISRWDLRWFVHIGIAAVHESE